MFTQHPEILVRVRGEVIEALGPDGTPTLEDIRKLKYRALSIEGMIIGLIKPQSGLYLTRPSVCSVLSMEAFANLVVTGSSSRLPTRLIRGGRCIYRQTLPCSPFLSSFRGMRRCGDPTRTFTIQIGGWTRGCSESQTTQRFSSRSVLVPGT